MGIQTVFFDMGGTIERISHTPEQRRQAALELQRILLEGGIDLKMDEHAFFDQISAGYRHYHNWSMQTMDELSTLSVWKDFILAGHAVDRQKLAPISEELTYTLEDCFFKREMRPEVPVTLEKLKQQGYKIGLISNVCSRGLVPANLEKYGIRNYFDPIILSSEFGRRKPDPSIFHYAARLSNTPTSLCAHVGDRIARDIVGARKAGFSMVIQIINDFDHGEADEGAEPDVVIHQFDALPDLLKSHPILPRKRSSGIRALLFDAGDILYYRPERGKKLEAFLKKSGAACKVIASEMKEALKQQVYHGEISQDEYREAYLRLYGLNDPAQIARGKAAMDADDNNITFFEGVPETLRELKQRGFMLGIITDTAMPLHSKLEWFERGGFGDVWDSFISSKDVGVQKPDQRMYQAALAQLGLGVGEAVFVGHHPVELEGARAIGMKTIAFNYEESTPADHYIDRFEDLLKLDFIADDVYEMEKV